MGAGRLGGARDRPRGVAVRRSLAEPSYAHTASFLACSALLALALAEKSGRASLAGLGALWGLVCLVRTQDAVLGVLAAPRLLQELAAARHQPWRTTVARLALFVVPAALVFLPQILFWQRLYSQPFVVALPAGFMHWLTPRPLPLLFSTWQGAFVWSPLLLAGIVGIALLPDRRWRIVLWIAVALEIYISAAAGDWWGSASFGARRLVVIAPLATLGLARLVDRCAGRGRRALALVVVLLGLGIGWNLRLAQYTLAGSLPFNPGNVREFARDYPPGDPRRTPYGWWDYALLAREIGDAERRLWGLPIAP